MFTNNESFCLLLGVGKWDSFLLVLVIDTHDWNTIATLYML